jgi:Protein of unknown function (DUF3341)
MSASNLFHGHHLPVAGSDKEPLQAIGARFDTPDALLDAVRLLREGGFTRYECYTPYPVHGLDRAMRLPKSVLSLLVLGGGVSAVLIALSMELIPSCLIYPLVVDGKPVDLNALPMFVPIVIALTLMIAAVTAVIGMIVLGGMPRWNHPMFAWDLFAKDASRGFFVSVESTDRNFTVRGVTELLHAAGAGDVTAIHLEEN